MKVDVLLGLQWGDEGKGKVVDVLAPRYDVIARFQGGPNAGHTLEFEGIKHVLHTIPSGIFHPGKVNIIGNGVVIDPVIFKKEIDALTAMGVDISRNLFISRKAHLILPTHRMLDAASEAIKGKAKIGSTLKGIGPAYMDKTGRNGLRVGDIEHSEFSARYDSLVAKHKELLSFYQFDRPLSDYETGFMEGIQLLRKMNLIDSEYKINDYLNEGRSVLAEGAQGSLLDIDFGSYPFVTSSNTITAGTCTGLGVAPSKIGEVYGIFKAYCTRVGSGPFPTELENETGELIRKAGNEFGATTGRPRRCGWLDLPALKYTIMLNGVTKLIMTKPDVLSGFSSIKVCTHYKFQGKQIDYMPYDIVTENAEPVYTEMPGWTLPEDGVHEINDLPAALSSYIDFLEAQLGVPVVIVSVGPDRSETLARDPEFAS
ncbi:MAG: adenylosuccinate synthase [Bacteroidetes bacterium]|nr:adenylosuccinate synthase [Bacteroidota bacterium]MBK7967748.1 adenylosuccinate synthase [Bacteroidota bacterium]MBK8876282.1 adenylosuccinate synthase [Bacteroidota bacterium]